MYELIEQRSEAMRLLDMAQHQLSGHRRDWERAVRRQVKGEILQLKKAIARSMPDKLDENTAVAINSARDQLSQTLSQLGI